jgi:hypothetical protein
MIRKQSLDLMVKDGPRYVAFEELAQEQLILVKARQDGQVLRSI